MQIPKRRFSFFKISACILSGSRDLTIFFIINIILATMVILWKSKQSLYCFLAASLVSIKPWVMILCILLESLWRKQLFFWLHSKMIVHFLSVFYFQVLTLCVVQMTYQNFPIMVTVILKLHFCPWKCKDYNYSVTLYKKQNCFQAVKIFAIIIIQYNSKTFFCFSRNTL